MIKLIEALNYRCLRYVRQPLGRLQVLVGPNASGKTTFLDIVSFLGDFVAGGPGKALVERTRNPLDLFWRRMPGSFELAIEAEIPQKLRSLLEKPFDTARYEVGITVDKETLELSIKTEKLLFQSETPLEQPQRSLFPESVCPPQTIARVRHPGDRSVLTKVPGGNDNFYSEVGKGWFPAFKLGVKRSTLGNLPADETRFPVSTWLRSLLSEGVQSISLNSRLLRQASPPSQTRAFLPDGSDLTSHLGFSGSVGQNERAHSPGCRQVDSTNH